MPMLLAMCSSSSNEPGIPRPPERQTVAAPGAARSTPVDPALSPVGSAEVSIRPAPPAATAKVRRIEDLPSASPVAVRPLRVDELPEERAGKGRRGKGKGEAALATKGAVGAKGVRRIEDLPAISDAVRPLRPDEVNPELVKRANELLWDEHAPVGTDIPFELNGKNYVARFAIHYHEFGGTKKPWGYHKGVTLYSTAP